MAIGFHYSTMVLIRQAEVVWSLYFQCFVRQQVLLIIQIADAKANSHYYFVVQMQVREYLII